MKVILLTELRGKGGEGDVIDVAQGYAENYLFRQGIALPATKGNLKQLEERRRNIQKREIRRVEDAEAVRGMLEGKLVEIEARVGEEGQLYGSVTATMIADAIQDQLGITVDRRRVELNTPIKMAGLHVVDDVEPGHLDGGVQLDPAAVHRDAELILDGVGDHGRGDGAVELALLAHARLDLDELALEHAAHGLGVLHAADLALLDVPAALLELLQVPLGGGQRDALPEEVVLGVALGHVDDVALAALAPELRQEDHFHVWLLAPGRPAAGTPSAPPGDPTDPNMGRLVWALIPVAPRAAVGDHGHGVGHERHGPRALDGVLDHVLVLAARARDPARLDLAAVGHVLAQELRVLVVDVVNPVLAELADLAAGLALVVVGHGYACLSMATASPLAGEPVTRLERDVLVVDVALGGHGRATGFGLGRGARGSGRGGRSRGGRGSRRRGGGRFSRRGGGVILAEKHGLAVLHLHLVGLSVERYQIFHYFLTSLIEMKRNSLRGIFSSSATMAMIMAASRSGVS